MYVVGSTVLRSLFTVFFTCTYLSAAVYVGVVFYFNRAIEKSWHLKKNLEKLRKKLAEPGMLAHKLRFGVSIAFLVINIILLIYVAVTIGSRGGTLSTPFILIFGCNMIIVSAYYLGRKFIDILQKETPRRNYEKKDETEDVSVGWFDWIAHFLTLDKCNSEETSVEDSYDKVIKSKNNC